MSSIGSNPTDPNDPLHYAPRKLRSGASQQTRPVHLASSRSGFDETPRDVVVKSGRHPLDPEFVFQPERRRSWLSVASRFAAAIGVVTIIGVIFFMMIPKSQGSDPTSAAPAKASEDPQALLQKFVQFDKSHENPPPGAAPAAPDD